MQHRQDDSRGELDWVELADAIFEWADPVLDITFDVAAAVMEGAGELLFSLLDGI